MFDVHTSHGTDDLRAGSHSDPAKHLLRFKNNLIAYFLGLI